MKHDCIPSSMYTCVKKTTVYIIYTNTTQHDQIIAIIRSLTYHDTGHVTCITSVAEEGYRMLSKHPDHIPSFLTDNYPQDT